MVILHWLLGQQPAALKVRKEAVLCFQSLRVQVWSLLKAVTSESTSVALSTFVSGVAKLFFPGSQECVCLIQVQGSEHCNFPASLLPLLVIKMNMLVIRKLKSAGSKVAFKRMNEKLDKIYTHLLKTSNFLLLLLFIFKSQGGVYSRV